jgi:tripartite-type tricarboxylate transporter receptor subunit TctC
VRRLNSRVAGSRFSGLGSAPIIPTYQEENMQTGHRIAGLFSIGLLGAGAAYGQDYPVKPVRIITLAAGGGSDFTSRQISQGIAGPLGQPVVIDNRTGVQASEAVSKSAPDGYTLLVSGASIWIFPLLQRAPYDVGDLGPITLISREPNILTVHPSLPVKTVKELIALAKSRPGELNYGAGVVGGPQHLAGELFKSLAGVDIVRIAYKGTAPSLTAQVGGEVQLTFVDAGAVMPHVRSGRLRALAVSSPEPSALAPGLPTVAASGVPGYELVGMTVIMAPAKTPVPIVTRLNQEIVRFLSQPDVKERFLKNGAEIVATSVEQFGAIMKSDIARMSKVIKEAGIKVE